MYGALATPTPSGTPQPGRSGYRPANFQPTPICIMSNILFIESDRLLAKNVEKALRRAGHKVRHVVDPQTAIFAADSKTPDLVILDLMLAGRSGTEFLYEFRSYPDWSQVPIIIFSTLPVGEVTAYQAELSKLNIRNFFYKPDTSLSQLVQAVNLLATIQS